MNPIHHSPQSTKARAALLLVLLLDGGRSLLAEAQPRPLVVNRPESVELKGGETHPYSLRLEAGQYAKIVVLQRGVDVVVTSYSPTGAKLEEVDSPNGMQGPEPIGILAEEAGPYRISVQSLDPKADTGRYDIRIETLLSPEEYRKFGIVSLPRKALLACSGAFELAPGHLITTGVLGEVGFRLAYTDHRIGRFGVLNAHSETEFFAGPTVLSEYPVSTFLTFRKGPGGDVIGVDVREGEGQPHFAKKVGPARSEEVSFQHDGLTLKGTLHLPPGKGPFPTLVYAHGSGPATRFVGHYPAYFNSFGFAVLAFDKRGAGQSQGDWRTASFQALAGDILAGVAYLKTRPEVNAKNLGVFGISQGGWVGSLVASQSTDIRFLLILAGSGVPVWENVAHEAYSAMKDSGMAGDVLEEGHAFARKVYQMAANGAGQEAVAALTAEQQGKPWVDAVFLTQAPKGDPWWSWFKLNGHVDPMEILPKVQCPTLWFLGDRDSQVPTAQSAPRIREAFRKGGNAQATLQVLEKAGHPLLECDSGQASELPTLKRFVPGYYDVLAAWLRVQAKR